MEDFKIYQLLHSMGITAKYKGFRQTILAVQLALQDEECLEQITEKIYWRVADQIGCDRSCVERDIRTIILRAWRIDPGPLQQLAGRPLSSVPTVSEFITDLTAYFKSQEEQQEKEVSAR